MKKKLSPVAPSPAWLDPAPTWAEAIDRYIAFLQIPSWRVNAFKPDGGVTQEAAEALRPKMMQVLNGMAARRSADVSTCQAVIDDLGYLAKSLGRDVPKAERCSKQIHWHFQRAFFLNAAGYSCRYCGRSAWEVFDEPNDSNAKRTLRFEIDHLVPRRKTRDVRAFDAGNLVAACRSCNTIKGEMDEERFLVELRSLGRAVSRKYGSQG